MRARLIERFLVICASLLGALVLAGFLWQTARSAVLSSITPSPLTTAKTSQVSDSLPFSSETILQNSIIGQEETAVLINEIDALTPGAEIAEFIELYDGGQGSGSLDGLVLVLFNGQDDRSYAAFDLNGYHSNSEGYFLVGNQAVPGVDLIFADTVLQNGPDAVALYQGTTADFPAGTSVTTTNLIDALVYYTGSTADNGLLILLEPGQPQVNEDSRTFAHFHSNQRCPNGASEPRQTQNYIQELPTPKAANTCPGDPAPRVSRIDPDNGANGLAIDSRIVLTFSEAVEVSGNWFAITCTHSGEQPAVVSGGDTVYILDPLADFAHGESCTVSVMAAQIRDLDTDDPPDEMATDFNASFSTVPTSTIIINEVDADTPDSDTAEFIELSAFGVANRALDGLVLVLFNGNDDRSYAAIDLNGYETGTTGYFVIGSAAVPNVDVIIPEGMLQNGADAVALYAGSAADFPNGSAITTRNLLDAIVYDTADDDDPGLLPLLLAGEAQIDENGRDNPTGDSNQRCPDGSGGQRQSSSYLQKLPTPGATNKCTFDDSPNVAETIPARDATAVPISTTITITFSEPVTVTSRWSEISCTSSGSHETTTSGDPTSFVLDPQEDFIPGETCSVTIFAAEVNDLDSDDPPDFMDANYEWHFSTPDLPPPALHLLINEVDADTPDSDTAEFIELSTGNGEKTKLDGLVLIFYNGSDDHSYAAIDLDGHQTTETGYFVVGNAAVANVDLIIPDGILQNGADAVALYAASVADFPNGRDVTTNNLLDALVYDTADDDDPGLLSFLLAGEAQIDENGRQNSTGDSNQRCPDSSGGQRRTSTYVQNLPTPGASNKCTFDASPGISATTPVDGVSSVSLDTTVMIIFSEPVKVTAGWFDISCTKSGSHEATAVGSDKSYTLDPDQDFATGESCAVKIFADKISDKDGDDPPDRMDADFQLRFSTVSPPPASHVIINELDSDTPGADQAEFVELSAGGSGKTDLSGLIVVFYNGSDDRSYQAIDLDGRQTKENGYFLIGNAAVAGVDLIIPDSTLQNGADAVALYTASADDFPNGTRITTSNLLDALVYDTADDDDPGLLPLLLAREPQIDENGRSNSTGDSNQRCPDSSGGQRRTSTYVQNLPTPGASNKCIYDEAPEVAETFPARGATAVPINTKITVTFSEPVAVTTSWFEIGCTSSGSHEATTRGGETSFVLDPLEDFVVGEICTVTIFATEVNDLDSDDPPDFMTANYEWHFSTPDPPPPALHLLINEVDADTAGSDTTEFIELSAGNGEKTNLDSLVIVLYNGSDDRSYAAIDLDGYQTTEAGYFVIGNAAVPNVDLIIPDGTLQNGADAVALFAASAADFPNGSGITTKNLLDALVYDTADDDDPGLLPLLLAGEAQIDESSRNNPTGDSNQRCPNSSGGQRRTSTYVQNSPTPGASNKCTFDVAPQVTGTTPHDGEREVAVNTTISVDFSEPVTLSPGWFAIDCEIGGRRSAAVSGTGATYRLTLDDLLLRGDSCTVNLTAANISDADDDPPDKMENDYQWKFSTIAAPAASHVLINEIDADTPGVDMAEFIEFYDGGEGNTALDGLVVVFYNGAVDLSYRSIDLTGFSTDGEGYFVFGNQDVAGVDLVFGQGILQNGADAVALYAGSTADFPNGTAITTGNLLDALVYGTAGAADPGLLPLLLAGEPQVDEDGRQNKDGDSNQRCPNGAGGQRRSSAYVQNLPTPGKSNKCVFDSPPDVSSTTPQDGAANVALDASITINFHEAVTVEQGWFEIICNQSGKHKANVGGGNINYSINPLEYFTAGETCRVTLFADKVGDQDEDDPPHNMIDDYQWHFSTTHLPAATHIVLNEVDADTVGADRLEFIELYDGGGGNTALDGLVIVFYNGTNDLSYRSFDLDGFSTNPEGYFVLGNEGTAGADVIFGQGSLQNGADAVALYEADGTDFPNGTPLTTSNLLDALVYDTADEDDEELLVLLHEGQPQVDEAGRGNKDNHSNQRCPNGAGGQRMSSGFLQNPATPGTENDCTVDLPPQVTGTRPLSGAVDIPLDSTITISFSEAVQVQEPWFTLSCEQSGEHALQAGGGPLNYTVTHERDFWAQESCTASVLAEQVNDLDGLADPMTADYSWSFSTGLPPFGACGDPATPIHFIQGNGASTPLSNTKAIVIEGIVSADFQGQDRLGGFFLQQTPQSIDADPQTAEGIFVYDNNLGLTVTVTEKVRLQGYIVEVDGLTGISQVIKLQRCGFAPLPPPTALVLPVAGVSTWESVEGMLVQISQTLAATGSDALGSEGAVDLALDGRLYYPTEIIAPGEAALSAADINNRRRITLEDGRRQNRPQPGPPYLGVSDTLRVGDTLAGLTGIVAENSAGYHIQPTGEISFTRMDHRPPPPPPPENLRLAYFDAGAFFNGDGQGGGFPGPGGAQTAVEFARQRVKIISALLAMQADVLALSGIENDGYEAESALQDLVDGLNQETVGAPYTLVNPGLPRLGETETAAGLIYRRDRVVPQGEAATTGTGPFSKPNSQPLVQAFTVVDSGESFVVAAVHFAGRETCPPAGDINGDQGDGQGCYALLRTQTAEALATWLAADPGGSGDEDILILGNLNAYRQEDSLAALRGAGYEDLSGYFAADGGYTSVRDGETGTLSYALASPSLAAQVQGRRIWHINAAEPQALDFRENNQAQLFDPGPYRSAVQDPLIVDLNLELFAARFDSDSPVRIGQPMHFTNQSSGAGIAGYEWDFGDGSAIDTNVDPQHLYTAVGDYRVKLTLHTAWGTTRVYRAPVIVTPMQLYFPIMAIK